MGNTLDQHRVAIGSFAARQVSPNWTREVGALKYCPAAREVALPTTNSTANPRTLWILQGPPTMSPPTTKPRRYFPQGMLAWIVNHLSYHFL